MLRFVKILEISSWLNRMKWLKLYLELSQLSWWNVCVVRRGDVLSAWSGIRPLVTNPNAKNTQSIARNHIIHVSQSNLVTIAGTLWFITLSSWLCWLCLSVCLSLSVSHSVPVFLCLSFCIYVYIYIYISLFIYVQNVVLCLPCVHISARGSGLFLCFWCF